MDNPFGGSTLDLGADCVARALAPAGEVFAALVRILKEYGESLADQRIQTVDLHFLTYTGLIAINLHVPDQIDQNLVAFELKDGDIVQTTADAVRHRLGHRRW
jgi:hypothetical protein